MDDLSKFLTFEVKKDIADRYFGFRKIIEEDSHSYQKSIINSSFFLEDKIGVELVRIFTLLHSEDLINAFLQLVKLPERLFMDSHLNRSERIRKTIFSGQTLRGFTKKSCFNNLFYDTYSKLHDHINEYQDTLKTLTEDQETICEQINLFYKKNDISDILNFLRSFEVYSQAHLSHLDLDSGLNSTQDLNDKLRLHPPPTVDKLLPIMPIIPPLKIIKSELKKLITVAHARRPEFDIRKH